MVTDAFGAPLRVGQHVVATRKDGKGARALMLRGRIVKLGKGTADPRVLIKGERSAGYRLHGGNVEEWVSTRHVVAMLPAWATMFASGVRGD